LLLILFSDEQQLVRHVVEAVLKRVKRNLDVSKYPTGLDQKIKEFETTVSLQQEFGTTKVIGIVGLGGVGKTTLAKEIFNRERSNYKRSCFLFEVREKSLESSQSMLLKDLAQLNEQVYSTDEGIEKLRRYLKSSQCLIIIDDVDHVRQLNALLLPAKDVLQSGSLILVTSRDKSVLKSSGIAESCIYMLTGLNRGHSEGLFCLHAFGQSHPLAGYEEIVGQFLNVCNGLPLSLIVLGAHLHGENDLKYWEAQFRKICKALPTDIHSRLKISYDGLDEEEKQIFLDIACFFIGEDRDTAIRIWDGSGWEGWLGLRNLQNRCLVEVDSENRIRMHDHLRDLGTDLAKKEPGCPLRLWRPTEDLNNQSPVRGIKNFAEWSRSIADMSSLQLLSVEGSCVESILSFGQSPQLIWLCWYNCSYSYLPTWIPMKTLRVLKVKGDELETLWQDEYQAPMQLRELDIAATQLLKIPKSIGQLKHLEKIVLKPGNFSEMSLESLPEEFCDLQSLKHLELKHCSRLKFLPDSFWKLTNLEHIDLSKCLHLQMLPYSFGNLRNLQRIFLNECYKLEGLPDSFGHLISLQHIELFDCFNLKMLPDSFENLTNLQHIDLSNCSNLQLLSKSFGNLTNLQHIDLSDCSSLQMLPDSFGNIMNLQHIDLSNCSNLEMLPDSFESLTSLQRIDLSNCSNLQKLSDSFGNLINLQHINLSRCSDLNMLPNSFGNLTNLRHIDLSRCSNLQMLPDSFGKLINLQHMDLSDCFNLQVLPESFGNLRSLQHMDLSECSNLQMLPDSFGNPRNLEHIDLSDCSNLRMLPESFGNLTNLKHIDLSDCSNLRMLPDSFGNLTNLKHLDLSKCSNLQRLPESFGNLMELQHLDLSKCPNLQKLPDSFGNLRNLQVFHSRW
jgi:Leucine-rich repeat (LRR) protein